MRLIHLPAGPKSSLDWDLSHCKEGTYFLDFDLNLFDPFDEGAFQSRFLAVLEFTKRQRGVGEVVLAHFIAPFLPFISPSEAWEEAIGEGIVSPQLVEAEILSGYLHRLSSSLPDQIEASLLVEVRDPSLMADMVIFFCKRRFHYFSFHFSHLQVPIGGEGTILVAIPQDHLYDSAKFGALLNRLPLGSYRCIPEEMLSEHWDGADHLIVDTNALGDRGMRMVRGFEATGGEIIPIGRSLGFSHETSLEIFLRSRGI